MQYTVYTVHVLLYMGNVNITADSTKKTAHRISSEPHLYKIFCSEIFINVLLANKIKFKPNIFGPKTFL